MRIAVIGPQYPDSFARNILVTLEYMGHNVLALDINDTLLSSRLIDLYKTRFFWYLRNLEFKLLDASPLLEAKVYQKLAAKIAAYRPQLIINILNRVPPEVVTQLKRQTGAAVVFWWPDSIGNLGRQYPLASPYDALFFKDRHLVEECRSKLGINNAFFLPECCNPIWHKRVQLTEAEYALYGCDITIAGNMYYNRVLMLEPLVKYNLKIWGGTPPRWLKSPLTQFHQRKFVAEIEKSKAFNAAKIVINTFHLQEITSISVRVFETAGCGAFQLCEYRPALEEFFEIGQELDVFSNRDELIEKVEYYLAHPEVRRAIADKGYKRAHQEHTYQKRLTEMLEIVKHISGKAVPSDT